MRASLPLCLALLMLAALPCRAQEPAGAEGEPFPGRSLVVGTKQAPPFAIRGTDGSWSGLSIELWRELAQRLHISYELEERDLAGLLSGLEDGSLDAAVAALTITPERELHIDFTHPFYTSGLGIAVAPEGRSAWLAALGGLFSWNLLKAVGALVLVLLITGGLVWLFERRRNPEQFGGGPLRGLGAGFWWSAVTMTTVGYGDKAPVTMGGRLLALFWMYASVITISGFTAAIASSLTLASFQLPLEGPEDLPRVRVATLAGSATAAVLDDWNIRYRGYDDIEAALDAVAEGEVDAVVHDAPILLYLTQEKYEGEIQVLPRTFERQGYGIGLPQGSPMREPINRALLEALAGPRWEELRLRYLGE